MRGSEGVREREEEVLWREERRSYEEYEKMREDEENEEEKEMVGNHWRKKNVGTYLMAKLHVV